jgi:hypothetical protein
MAFAERIINRRLPSTIRRGGGILGKLFPGKAGDIDIDDITVQCKCRELDSELKKRFKQEFGSNYTLDQETATMAISRLKRWTKELAEEKDCSECNDAYDWNNILERARDRGVKSVRRLSE